VKHLSANSAFAFVIMLFSARLALAGNQNAGTLSGRVSDQSGGSIAFATVTLMDSQHPFKGTLTRKDGTYQFAGLPPGRYQVRVNPGAPVGNLASPLFGSSNSMAYSSGPDRQAGNNRSFDFQALFTF
jgi:hypothetical protein